MSICNGCETVRKINELIDRFDKLEDNNHEIPNMKDQPEWYTRAWEAE